jgi:hypothetical protein
MDRADIDRSGTMQRYIEIIHDLGLRAGWQDRDGEGRTRNYLLGLRVGGALDRQALLAEMRARGHDDVAVRRLDRLIDKTYREPGAHP